MSFLNSQIISYFKNNLDDLSRKYPGLTSSRLVSEVNDYLETNGNFNQFNTNLYYEKNLTEGRPLEYISNTAFFYNSSFFVNDKVLIPRSESEILVSMAVEYIQSNTVNSLLEVGVGSGALILSILMDINKVISKVWATDISENAMEIAKYNYYLHQNKVAVEQKVNFLISEKFQQLKTINQKFDLIISNPPYIMKNSDFDAVHFNVTKFEPHEALFIKDEDYNSWFDDFFKGLKHFLNPGGVCLMEGHEDHLEKMAKKYSNNFEIEIINDYTNRNRFLRILNG